jgi:hypothetical protein
MTRRTSAAIERELSMPTATILCTSDTTTKTDKRSPKTTPRARTSTDGGNKNLTTNALTKEASELLEMERNYYAQLDHSTDYLVDMDVSTGSFFRSKSFKVWMWVLNSDCRAPSAGALTRSHAHTLTRSHARAPK